MGLIDSVKKVATSRKLMVMGSEEPMLASRVEELLVNKQVVIVEQSLLPIIQLKNTAATLQHRQTVTINRDSAYCDL